MFIIHIYVPYKADSGEGVILVQVKESCFSIATALTIIGHGENGDLGDGAVSALHSAGTFVDGGQISVHVAWKASTAGHFLSGSRDLQVRSGW